MAVAGSENSLPEAEVAAIIAREKFIRGDVEWKNEPANSLLYRASWLLLDAEQRTIPGLTVELMFREDRLKGDCKYKFTLFSFRPPRLRAYQIEVVPPDRRSHTEEGKKLYGPHQHFGDRAEAITESANLGCGDHEAWFNVFLRNANIGFAGKYLPPGSPQWGLGL